MDKIDELSKENEKLKKLNQFMRDRLEWFAQNSFNADQANWSHVQALKDLEEFEKELNEENTDEDVWLTD